MKTRRQRKIIELISNYDIETQEELANLLINKGFAVTQATVSRDIRELNLTKVQTRSGKQKYVVPNSTMIVPNSKFMRVLNDGILSVETAGNILVIKTVSGMAMAVGAALDAINIKEIVGCIAGDDTIMCVVKNADDCEKVKEYLENYMN
ncbi:MAG: arginine repressor [Eubacterium sp.]